MATNKEQNKQNVPHQGHLCKDANIGGFCS